MGDISIMARRLKDGRVQYGWSGNGGHFSNVGARLLAWYDDPDKIDYLFSLGRLSLIGKPGSEHGGYPILLSHHPEGTRHWFGKSERAIFSRIAFIDYGYFYDWDETWYYIDPGPIRIKIPLMYIGEHLDKENREFEELRNIGEKLALRMIEEPGLTPIMKRYNVTIEELRNKILQVKNPIHDVFYDQYRKIYKYFDDWAVVKTDNEYKCITEFLIKPKQKGKRIETIDW